MSTLSLPLSHSGIPINGGVSNPFWYSVIPSVTRYCFLTQPCVFCVPAVLCADRVGQMTKTYSDIDAVTRLLEEVGMLLFVHNCC